MQKFIVIEPSKAGAEHLTFNASVISEFVRRFPSEVFLAASTSHFEALGNPSVPFCPLPIVSIVKRRFLFKVLTEAVAIVKAFNYARRLGIRQAVVLSVFPPLLSWLSLVASCFGVSTTLVLHGELEGIVDPSKQRPTSFGYWVKRFFGANGFRRLKGFVLSEGIYHRLTSIYPEAATHVGWANHPIQRSESSEATPRDIVFATVGLATEKKHAKLFQQFSCLSSVGQRSAHVGMTELDLYERFRQDITFFCIPGSHLIQRDFFAALQRVKNAVFPYDTTSYRMTVSGAMLDAIGCGCRVVCLNNAFALDLVSAGLPVTIADSLEQLLVDGVGAVEKEVPWKDFSAESFCDRLLRFSGIGAHNAKDI